MPNLEPYIPIVVLLIFSTGIACIVVVLGHLFGPHRPTPRKLAPYEYPKEIEFIDALPMTTTGKVQRRVLRAREEERLRGAGG